MDPPWDCFKSLSCCLFGFHSSSNLYNKMTFSLLTLLVLISLVQKTVIEMVLLLPKFGNNMKYFSAALL